MRVNRYSAIVAVVFMGSIFASVALAVPNLINYQGRLTDNAGNPTNGTVQIVFSIYSAVTGGTALWTETQSVTATNGIYNVMLGSITSIPSDLFDEDSRYLGVKIGADSECTPRQQIASVAYAITAKGVETESITGSMLARESVWPEHRGRSNTVKNWHLPISGEFCEVPPGKTFVLTDIIVEDPGTTYWIMSDSTRVLEFQVPPGSQIGHIGLNAGISFPAGSKVSYGTVSSNSGMTISGYEFAN